MAETAVTTVIGNLAPLLAPSANLSKRVRQDVLEINLAFLSIRPFLKDADKKAEREDIGGQMKPWVKRAREAAYQVEDIVDEYMLFISSLPRHGNMFKKPKLHPEIISKIKETKTALHSIMVSYPRAIEGTAGDNDAVPVIQEDGIIGLQIPKMILVKRVSRGEPNRIVIPVVGMEGVGKTTLAKEVYRVTKGGFDSYDWVNVGPSYKMDKILRGMIKVFHEQARRVFDPEAIAIMDETHLAETLRQFLDQKRYMVVFDDVWGTHFWRKMGHILPDNTRRSRVLITTCLNDVCQACEVLSVADRYELRPLTDRHSWELFCKKAFRNDNQGNCPRDLEKLTRNIVQRCNGLPLPIVAIADHLSTKEKVVPEWQKFSTLGKKFGTHLTEMKGLSNGYHDLPYHLQPCFLYLGIFPEGYFINCARLIRLWVAEGFVKGGQEQTPEEAAHGYMKHLADRNLVQLTSDDFGRIRNCRVHSVMRVIIRSKSEDLNFSQVCMNEDQEISENTRRLSIHRSMKNVPENVCGSRNRSLLFFDDEKMPEPFVNKFLTRFRLLKVLDLEKASLNCLPEEVGELFLLRYLSVRDTKVSKLPKSVGKLVNLETLDMKRSLVRELPTEIHKLHKLRNLLAYSVNSNTKYRFDSDRGVTILGRIGSLVALEKLYFVEKKDAGSLVSDLSTLTKLKKLAIEKLKRDDSNGFCDAVNSMKELQSLSVFSANKDEFLVLENIDPLQKLQHVSLGGRLEKLPLWIMQATSLVQINLILSRLVDDPFEVLGDLPNLVEIRLFRGFDGDRIEFQKEKFKKLKNLHLEHLKELSLMKIEDGALPVLQKLKIEACKKLGMPLGIQHLRKLESLELYDMPLAFARNMRPHKGQAGYNNVKHISNILFHHNLGRYGEFGTCNLSVQYAKLFQEQNDRDGFSYGIFLVCVCFLIIASYGALVLLKRLTKVVS